MTPGVLAWWRTNAARTRFTPAISDRLASALAARTTARGNFIARRSDSTALSAGRAGLSMAPIAAIGRLVL